MLGTTRTLIRMAEGAESVGRLFRRGVAVVFAVAAVALDGAAHAQQSPPATPILRVETGMHVDQIKDLSVSPDGGVLSTVSDDKTIRLWELATGELIDTLRIPIARGDEGLLFTTAIAPTGRLVLAGGLSGLMWDNRSYLYFFERETGVMRFRFQVPGAIQKISYFPKSGSPQYLAIAFSSTTERGVMVIDASGQTVMEDREFRGRPTWVEFGPDGRLTAVAADGFVRLYTPSLELVGRTQLEPQNASPSMVRFSPDGAHLAIGYYNQRAVDVLSSNDLRRVARMPLTLSDGEPSVNAVAWGGAADLFIGGAMSRPDGVHVVRRWRDFRSPDAFEDIPVSRDAIATLEPTPNGEIVFASADPAWGVIGPDGAVRYARSNVGGDHREIYEGGFQITNDATQLEFRFRRNGASRLYRFDAASMTVARIDRPSDDADWSGPSAPSALDGWRNTQEVSVNGRAVALDPSERARSAHQLPSGEMLLGADFNLYLLDASGAEVDRLALDSAVFGVLATPSGDRAVIALADGSFRWLSLEPGRRFQEIGAFYFAEGERWVAWLPDGRFGHSPTGGDDLVGYHVNRASNEAAKWVELGQLYRRFHQPAAIRFALGGVEQAALPAAVVEEIEVSAAELAAERPEPEIQIEEFCFTDPDAASEKCLDASQLRRGLGRIDARFSLPAGVRTATVKMVSRVVGIPKAFDVFVNGRTTSQQTRGLGRLDDGGQTTEAVERRHERTIALSDGENVIQGLIIDAYMSTESNPIIVDAAPSGGAPERRLFALIVGIDAYQNVTPLNAAATDAKRFGEILETKTSDDFVTADVTVLTDANATRDQIFAELERIAETSTPNDSVLVYLAGHGVVDDVSGLYTFIPVEGTGVGGDPVTGVTEADLKERIGAIRAKHIFLTFDTCYSGAFDPATLSGGMEKETGFYVLASSSSVEEALDQHSGGKYGLVMTAFDDAAQNGAFGTEQVRVDLLLLHTQQRVTEIAADANYSQTASYQISASTTVPLIVVDASR